MMKTMLRTVGGRGDTGDEHRYHAGKDESRHVAPPIVVEFQSLE